MSENFYTRNNEGKLELHLDRQSYLALDDDAKQRIKGNFLWKRNGGYWISRCKDPNLDKPIVVAIGIGLCERDAATVGQSIPDCTDVQNCKKLTSEEKAIVRTEYEKVWGNDSRMINYCVNKTAQIAILPNDDIIAIEKQHIKKNFCFGENGYDYDEAAACAQRARTSADYFKRENMQGYVRQIEELNNVLNHDDRYWLLFGISYHHQSEDCRLRNMQFAKDWEIIDACGGSARLDELPGKEITYRQQRCRIATDEEIRIVLNAVQLAAKEHEKKVDAYLKRYGTSKVNAWTYWSER